MADITLRRLDLMGYTRETQMWLVSGSPKARNFIATQSDLGTFDFVQHMGSACLGLRGHDRAWHFREFAQACGFTVGGVNAA